MCAPWCKTQGGREAFFFLLWSLPKPITVVFKHSFNVILPQGRGKFGPCPSQEPSMGLAFLSPYCLPSLYLVPRLEQQQFLALWGVGQRWLRSCPGRQWGERWGSQPLHILHCPNRYHLQNTNSKVKLVRISRWCPQCIKAQVWSPLLRVSPFLRAQGAPSGAVPAPPWETAFSALKVFPGRASGFMKSGSLWSSLTEHALLILSCSQKWGETGRHNPALHVAHLYSIILSHLCEWGSLHDYNLSPSTRLFFIYQPAVHYPPFMDHFIACRAQTSSPTTILPAMLETQMTNSCFSGVWPQPHWPSNFPQSLDILVVSLVFS